MFICIHNCILYTNQLSMIRLKGQSFCDIELSSYIPKYLILDSPMGSPNMHK